MGEPGSPPGSGCFRAVTGIALGLLSGVLLALPFLVAHVWAVHYVALAPLAVLLARSRAVEAWLFVTAGLLAYLAVAAGSMTTRWWTPLLIALVGAPFVALFPAVVRVGRVRLGLPLVLLLPVAWVATEWARVRFSLGGAGLFVVGAAHFPVGNVIQIAGLTGVAGVSFLVAAGSGAVADLILHWRRRRAAGLSSLAAFVVLLAAVLAYGRARVDDLDLVEGPRVALVRPNAPEARDPATALRTFEHQLAFTRTEVARGRADLIVWPERAIPVPPDRDPRFMEGLRSLGSDQGAEIVFGAPTPSSSDSARVHSSAYHLSSSGEVLGRYDQRHRIAWAGLLPLPAWSGGASANGGPVVPGSELRLFESEGGGHSFAAVIGSEITTGAFAREAAAAGADFILNLASEGVSGPPLYRHLFGHAVFRAVENRIALVRVGNEGMSGFIDPSGRVRLLRGRRTGRLWLDEGTLVDRVSMSARGVESFYTRRGDLLAHACVGLSALVLLLGWRRGPAAEPA